jgi:hypothetical protein
MRPSLDHDPLLPVKVVREVGATEDVHEVTLADGRRLLTLSEHGLQLMGIDSLDASLWDDDAPPGEVDFTA